MQIARWMSLGVVAAVAVAVACSSRGGGSGTGGSAGASGASGAGGSSGSSGASGSGGSGADCPINIYDAAGLACAPEGLTCGAELCNDCGLPCDLLHCYGGIWTLSSNPVDCGDAGPGNPCNDATSCLDDEYCDFDGGGECGLFPGICVKRPQPGDCPAQCSETCGCDGISYCNDCLAAAAGFDVSAGPCGSSDAGGR